MAIAAAAADRRSPPYADEGASPVRPPDRHRTGSISGGASGANAAAAPRPRRRSSAKNGPPAGGEPGKAAEQSGSAPAPRPRGRTRRRLLKWEDVSTRTTECHRAQGAGGEYLVLRSRIVPDEPYQARFISGFQWREAAQIPFPSQDAACDWCEAHHRRRTDELST